MFNLQFMPDPQDPKLLYIEPWKDFYSSGSVVDWSQKSDENAEQNLTNGGVRNNVPENHMPFVQYIQDIKDGIYYTEVMAYRKAKTEETKRRLSAVTPSGKFKKQVSKCIAYVRVFVLVRCIFKSFLTSTDSYTLEMIATRQ